MPRVWHGQVNESARRRVRPADRGSGAKPSFARAAFRRLFLPHAARREVFDGQLKGLDRDEDRGEDQHQCDFSEKRGPLDDAQEEYRQRQGSKAEIEMGLQQQKKICRDGLSRRAGDPEQVGGSHLHGIEDEFQIAHLAIQVFRCVLHIDAPGFCNAIPPEGYYSKG
jgi:hypothetical protein